MMMMMMMMIVNCFCGMVDDYALCPAGAIVRDSYHCKSLTRREQHLNLRRIRVQTLLNEVVQ